MLHLVCEILELWRKMWNKNIGGDTIILLPKEIVDSNKNAYLAEAHYATIGKNFNQS